MDFNLGRQPLIPFNPRLALALVTTLAFLTGTATAKDSRPRLIIETDAGGDPDDEQSLVRFLVYANEFDIEGLIANRPVARNGENKNPVRDGLGIVQAQVHAYSQCYADVSVVSVSFPTPLQETTEPKVVGSNPARCVLTISDSWRHTLPRVLSFKGLCQSHRRPHPGQ